MKLEIIYSHISVFYVKLPASLRFSWPMSEVKAHGAQVCRRSGQQTLGNGSYLTLEVVVTNLLELLAGVSDSRPHGPASC